MESGAVSVCWNSPPDPQQKSVFNKLDRYLKDLGVNTVVTPPNLLVDPKLIQTDQGKYYKVFTPFWRKCLKILTPPPPRGIPKWKCGSKLRSDNFSSIQLLNSQLGSYWTPGESAARKRLKEFIKKDIYSYDTSRDLMSENRTSRLSAHLRWGEISINEVWSSIQSLISDNPKKAIDTFISEIGFREFSYYLLHYFPELSTENFLPKFNHFPWEGVEKEFTSWKEGKTGYPIVDAGMRQLKETGWMHNRARMIVGSFLTKDLLIDWKKGEEWFWESLVDGDPALNAFNWQWVAGSGVDAAPYFRIFNPVLQGEKFDKNGEYARKWIPELEKIPGKKIHQPWRLSHSELLDYEISYGETYPKQIIDHAQARTKALEIFKKLPSS